ncbi:MAG: diguanylate cyclase [Pseudomonadota bacterium]
MSHSPEPNAEATGGAPAAAAADAEHVLARVQAKVDAARAVLLRLLQEVVVAESRLSNSQASQMLEANERLVLAALRDQHAAEAASQSLSDLTRLAEIDPLTLLPNRALLLDRFGQAIAAAKRHGSCLALLFLDLDDFKQINDGMGHVAGDEALQKVALRLGQAVREADTVSRYGGDEFVILLTEVSHAADAAVIAGKLLTALGEPMRVADRTLRMSASIGVSIYPDDGESFETLIGQADAAMYRAKTQGPGRFALHGDAVAQLSAQPAPAALGARAQALAAQARRHAQLQEANEQLVLAALGAQDLQAAAERAQQQQADFMAAVADELSDRFAPIRLASAMLGRQSGDDVLLARAQAMVDQQALRMARLVEAARARSRTARMLAATGGQTSDLVAVLHAAVRDAIPVLDLRQQHLAVVMPDGAVVVRGDAERLGHVLGNLLDNASKYSADGGSIRLEGRVQGASAVLTVGDDGIGITPAVLPHIFEPFGQDSRAIGFHGTSTGIGLPVVLALVTELGGTVVAESAGNGRGSRFVVTLPLAEAGSQGLPAGGPGAA